MPAKDTYVSLDALKLKHRRWRHYDIRLFDRLSDITVVAPHGGYIEAGTSYLARQIAASDLNLFDFQGLLKTYPHKLHVTSSRFKEPLLEELLTRSRLAVSVHSMGVDGTGEIWIGGQNKALVARFCQELQAAGFSARTDIPRYKGIHPQNFVNAARQKGVQIEIAGDVLRSLFANEKLFDKDDSNVAANTRLHDFVRACRTALDLPYEPLDYSLTRRGP